MSLAVLSFRLLQLRERAAASFRILLICRLYLWRILVSL